MSRSLSTGFLRSVREYPDRAALEVAGEKLSYRQLYKRASVIAAALIEYDGGGQNGDEPALTAVFAHRSETAFVGVLAALLRGHGYVPLNRTFPTARSNRMLDRSRCRAVIVDRLSAEQLPEVLAGIDRPLVLIFPEAETAADVDVLKRRFAGQIVLGPEDLAASAGAAASLDMVPDADPEAIAYLLFTSGSTGDPKGVMVAHRNVTSFIDTVVERYGVVADDRLSQTFDMTFDLSVFDMFVAWGCGACVCCPSQKTLINPGRFIRDNEITIWFSVPSTGVFMKRLGALKQDRYPSLRWSLFCGEPLPMEVAKSWQAAAPNSVVENLYGPTEVTISCTVYRWDSEISPTECVNGVVPIGEPLTGMTARVADVDYRAVAAGEEGELLMSGTQVTPGYWRDAEKTAAVYVTPPDTQETYYRTGDRVKRLEAEAPLVYLGRIDHQIQIHGHRVELGEIEALLREETGQDGVIALGWPLTVSGAGGIVAFVGHEDLDVDEILRRVAKRLPEYMVPRTIYLRERLPLNANGKFDRKALLQELEEIK